MERPSDSQRKLFYPNSSMILQKFAHFITFPTCLKNINFAVSSQRSAKEISKVIIVSCVRYTLRRCIEEHEKLLFGSKSQNTSEKITTSKCLFAVSNKFGRKQSGAQLFCEVFFSFFFVYFVLLKKYL